METSKSAYQAPPAYSTDILPPPTWNGPPGQLIPWSVTSSTYTERYAIYGSDTQVLQVSLLPGESVGSEPGAMVYKADSIAMTTGVGGFMRGMKRVLGGESFFRNTYTNMGSAPACISLTPDFPAKIIPVDLSRSGTVHVTPGGYVAHIGEVNITFKFVRKVMAGCFGGGGFLLLKITGTGTVFLAGGGTIMEKILAPSEVLLVDTESLVGFSESADYDVKTTGGCVTCCCGGEGLFNTKITGPGLVIIQSMSKHRLIKSLGIMHGGGGGSSGGGAGGAGGV